MVEVPQTDRAVIFVLLTELAILLVLGNGILIEPENVGLLVVRADTDLVSVFHLIVIIILDFLENPLLLSQFFLIQLDFW